jgi:hypothetical protein
VVCGLDLVNFALLCVSRLYFCPLVLIICAKSQENAGMDLHIFIPTVAKHTLLVIGQENCWSLWRTMFLLETQLNLIF